MSRGAGRAEWREGAPHRRDGSEKRHVRQPRRRVGVDLEQEERADTRDQPGEGRHRVDEPVGEQSSEVVERNHCGLRELRPERERRVRNFDTRVPLDNAAHRDGRGLEVAAEAVQDG